MIALDFEPEDFEPEDFGPDDQRQEGKVPDRRGDHGVLVIGNDLARGLRR